MSISPRYPKRYAIPWAAGRTGHVPAPPMGPASWSLTRLDGCTLACRHEQFGPLEITVSERNLNVLELLCSHGFAIADALSVAWAGTPPPSLGRTQHRPFTASSWHSRDVAHPCLIPLSPSQRPTRHGGRSNRPQGVGRSVAFACSGTLPQRSILVRARPGSARRSLRRPPVPSRQAPGQSSCPGPQPGPERMALAMAGDGGGDSAVPSRCGGRAARPGAARGVRSRPVQTCLDVSHSIWPCLDVSRRVQTCLVRLESTQSSRPGLTDGLA
jgi:hypothetical protein